VFYVLCEAMGQDIDNDQGNVALPSQMSGLRK